jgi:hypothetical protein
MFTFSLNVRCFWDGNIWIFRDKMKAIKPNMYSKCCIFKRVKFTSEVINILPCQKYFLWLFHFSVKKYNKFTFLFTKKIYGNFFSAWKWDTVLWVHEHSFFIKTLSINLYVYESFPAIFNNFMGKIEKYIFIRW